MMLRAYAHGIFPMSDARDDPDTFWVEPKRRAILPLGRLHVSSSLAKTVRRGRFEVTADTAFSQVISTCAAQADDRRETWINAEIEEAFNALHSAGMAHSIECWSNGELVGGLYGLALGRAFFGESMFSRQTDASKVALVWLVARLQLGGFSLLDCQFMTDHLASLGVVEISQAEYLAQLDAALAGGHQVSIAASSTNSSASSSSGSGAVGALGGGADWGAVDGFLGSALLSPSSVDGGAKSSPGKLILQALTQTS
jgi:leucyl/phenylalanyl-tRNA--protein transferase